MSGLERPTTFIAEMQRLLALRVAATTDEDRAEMDAEMALLFRYNATGRLQEYFANRRAQQESA
jgi:hypothetical protein